MTGYRVAVGFGLVFAVFAMALMALPVMELAGGDTYSDAWTRRSRMQAEAAMAEVPRDEAEAVMRGCVASVGAADPAAVSRLFDRADGAGESKAARAIYDCVRRELAHRPIDATAPAIAEPVFAPGRRGASEHEIRARDPRDGGAGWWVGAAAGAVGSCFASFVALGLAGASLLGRR